MELTNLNKDKVQRRKRSADIGNMVYGKVPPQAKDLEEAVLGAVMVEKNAFDEVINILQPECFYVDAHQKIFQAMVSLKSKSQPIDILTVCEELRCREELEMVGGKYYVTQLTNSVVSSANIIHHGRIVFQKFLQREVIRICGESISEAYEDSTDAFMLLDDLEEQLSQLGVQHVHGEMTSMDTAIVQTMKQVEEWRQMDDIITGVSSGYYELDRVTLGWQNGDLIILAARPGEGKTAFALNIAKNAALNPKKPVPVALWSLEMKYLRLCLRLLSSISEILLYKMQTGSIDDAEMKELYRRGVQVLAKAKIFFDDKAGATMQQLKAKARRIVRKEKVGLIIVDYLQLMKGKGGNREQEISGISRELKELAQELNVPIIALSQLSRAVETRGAKDDGKKTRQPQLSDLRESGAIEQDADMVIFIWKPTDGEILQDASLSRTRYIRVAKQRNGVPMTFECEFRNDIQLFDNIKQQGAYSQNSISVPAIVPNPDKFIEPSKNWTAIDEDPFTED